jgi:hypothetical protein
LPNGGTSIGNLYADIRNSSNDYAHPIYYGQPSDPVLTISGGGTNGMKIHVPANAGIPLGSDGHISVVQPPDSSGNVYEYDFWKASISGSTISGAGASRQLYGSNGMGIVTPAMRKADPSIGGQTAPYFGLHAGVIRGPELEAGQINHSLFIVIKCGTTMTTAFGDASLETGSQWQRWCRSSRLSCLQR